MIITMMTPDPFGDWAERLFDTNDQLVSIVHAGKVDEFFDYHDKNHDGLGASYFIQEDVDWSDFVNFKQGLDSVIFAAELLEQILNDDEQI